MFGMNNSPSTRPFQSKHNLLYTAYNIFFLPLRNIYCDWWNEKLNICRMTIHEFVCVFLLYFDWFKISLLFSSSETNERKKFTDILKRCFPSFYFISSLLCVCFFCWWIELRWKIMMNFSWKALCCLYIDLQWFIKLSLLHSHILCCYFLLLTLPHHWVSVDEMCFLPFVSLISARVIMMVFW